MAIKQVTDKPVSYIPRSEREEKQPFTVWFTPLTKGQHDEYVDSLSEIRRNKVVSRTSRASEILFKKTLAAGPNDGAILENAVLADGKIGSITDKELAVKFLLGVPAEIGNEVDQAIRGLSTLDDNEEKN